jgi:hypothetical protein
MIPPEHAYQLGGTVVLVAYSFFQIAWSIDLAKRENRLANNTIPRVITILDTLGKLSDTTYNILKQTIKDDKLYALPAHLALHHRQVDGPDC